MKSPLSIYTILSLLSVLFLFASNSEAQKIKIKKTKGTSAIIESSVPLEEGQVYDLATGPISQDVDYKATGPKSRQNSLSIGGSLFSLRGDDYQRNSFALQGRYGWNFTNLEFGLLGQFTSDDLGGGATNDFSGGGFFDYNLLANRDPKTLVYGAVAVLTFGSKQFPASRGGGSATTLDINAGAFLSWFINASSTALRIEAFFDSQQISTTVKQTNVLGFGSRVLMSFYF
jgi:hypothetical protein